jgi:hypothetical protein
MRTTSSKPSDARLTALSAADIVLLTADADADADADEAVPMPMERPSNLLLKMVASGVGASVVTT